MERRDLQHDLLVALAASGVVENVTFDIGETSTKQNDMFGEAIEVRELFPMPILRAVSYQLSILPHAGAAAA
jgi:hypothetical protein